MGIVSTMLMAIILSILLDKFILGKKMNLKNYIKSLKKDKRKIISLVIITILIGSITGIMGITVNTIFLELLLIILYRIVIIDMEEKIIDMKAFIIFAILGVVSLIIDNGVYIINSLLTGAVSLILFYIVSKISKNAFGIGDAMILGVIGLIFGYQGLCEILIISSALGFLVGAILLIRKGFKNGKNLEIPFTPFIFIAITILIIFNNI